MKQTIATILLSVALAAIAAPGTTEATTRRLPGLGCVPAFNGSTNARYDNISVLNQSAGHAGFLCPGDQTTQSTLSLTSARVYYTKQNTSTSFTCNLIEVNTAGSSWQGTAISACSTAGGCATGGSNLGRGYLDWSGAELPPSLTSLLSYSVTCLVPNVVSSNQYSGIEGYYFNHANE